MLLMVVCIKKTAAWIKEKVNLGEQRTFEKKVIIVSTIITGHYRFKRMIFKIKRAREREKQLMKPLCCFGAFLTLMRFVSAVKNVLCTNRGLCCCNLKSKASQ